MKQTPILITLLLLFSLGFLSCERPPTEEMNNAVEAVTRAENDADAVLHAGNILARAQDALQRMHAEADYRNFDSARFLAAEAIAFANRAVSEGQIGALRAREEAASLLLSLRSEVGQTEQGLRAAQAAGLELDYDELGRNFEAARQNADRAEVALAGNRYHDALERGIDARIGLNDINQRLTIAVAAISVKK